MNHGNSVICEGVVIGEDSSVGEFCIIGNQKSGSGILPTRIGKNSVVRSHTVIYSGNIIGDNFQTGHHVNIREENKIGNNVSIGTKSIVEHHIVIEDNVRIHSNVFVPEFSVLKKGCWLGPCVVLTNAPFPLGNDIKNRLKGVVIEENAKIGANSTILPGVRIGRNSVIGAGSVVTKDVPPESVAVGNPAKVIKNVSELTYKEDGVRAY